MKRCLTPTVTRETKPQPRRQHSHSGGAPLSKAAGDGARGNRSPLDSTALRRSTAIKGGRRRSAETAALSSPLDSTALRRSATIKGGRRRSAGAAALSHCRPGRTRGCRCANRVAVPRKLSTAYPRTQRSHSGHRPKRIESRVSNRYSYTRIHNSTNHNRETRKQPQTPPTNAGQNTDYTFNAASLSLKHSHTRYGAARGAKPDTETQTVRARCYRHRFF